MELKEYRILCKEVGVGCNPKRLNQKPDELVRLKVKLTKEFKNLQIKGRYPSFMTLMLSLKNTIVVMIAFDYKPGYITVSSSLPGTGGIMHLENDDKLISSIWKIIKEVNSDS